MAGNRRRTPITREDRAAKFFHPDFPRDNTLGGAIIQTSTGLCFRFPIGLLASVSDLFADAAEVSQHGDSLEPITLDIVRPEGLYLILSVLHPITDSHTSENKMDRLRRISAEDIIEGYNTAEILGISSLAQMLLPFFIDPFVRFALASGSNDPSLIQEMAVQTFDRPFNSISRYAETVLNSLNPSLFVRLRVLHSKRKEIPKSLLPTLMLGQPIPDGLNDFTRSCRKNECNALKSVKGRAWTQLRNRAASDVWAGLVKTSPLPCQWKDVADWALEGSCRGCNICKKRLSECFGKALEVAENGLPKEL